MISTEYVRLMAAYSAWQNRSLFDAGDTLDDAARRAERGAFFGSIHATLNHALWGDQMWMHRLASTSAPDRVDIPSSIDRFESWSELRVARVTTDASMIEWSERVIESELEGEIEWYSGATDSVIRRPRWALVVQLFNHGTHHRGQTHAMLTAAGAAPSATDVQALPPELYPWPPTSGS